MVETSVKHSDSKANETRNTRIQVWVPIALKQKVKVAVSKTHGDTIQSFVERSLTYTMDFPQIPTNLQHAVKAACEEAGISSREFMEMAVEQCLTDLGYWKDKNKA